MSSAWPDDCFILVQSQIALNSLLSHWHLFEYTFLMTRTRISEGDKMAFVTHNDVFAPALPSGNTKKSIKLPKWSLLLFYRTGSFYWLGQRQRDRWLGFSFSFSIRYISVRDYTVFTSNSKRNRFSHKEQSRLMGRLKKSGRMGFV